jgi:hypothetical protein
MCKITFHLAASLSISELSHTVKMILNGLITIVLLIGSSLSLPTATKPLDSRFKVPGDDQSHALFRELNLKPRATDGPQETDGPQAFHLIGFDNDQSYQVRQAIADAQYLGQIGLLHLQRITKANQMTPEFQTYFGNEYNTDNLDTIRNIVNNLATINNNGLLGFVYNSVSYFAATTTL